MSFNTTIDRFNGSDISSPTSDLDFSKPRILIVDDNPDNLRLLSNILTESGYSVQRAISGQLALNAVRANPPDLILLDIIMPDIDGYEVCRQLKSADQTSDILVIFFSVLTEELNKVKAFDVGGVDYITKPFQAREVLMRVKHQLTILNLQRQLQEKNKNLTEQNFYLHAEVLERKQFEQKLKRSQSELELTNDRLKKALKNIKKYQSKLIQSEKISSLGKMVAGVAHEINNPVSFIYGNLSHLDSYRRDLLDIIQAYQEEYPQKSPKIENLLEEIDLEFIKEDLPKLFASMREGSDRIRKIVLSLRKFSRLDESTLKSVDLHEGIESTLLIIGHRLHATENRAPIVLQKEYDNLPPIICNPGHINQVLMNLLSNAIDFLDLHFANNAGENDRIPTIWICTQLCDPNTVKIEITDNASGIPEDVCPYIFDPFFTTKPIGMGSGLGLSVSYSIIVEEHGGKLECNSLPGVGTTLTIELPIQGNLVDS